ncbi:MAG TPA: TraR/DksA C4-type zinc finger protein [Gemmatales bacterium]|nr:TraR/DksA C4-type zinc finger protein [Gemmatales bacterium]HMP58236.1 TraR/DksA C4-type zinc finger protein [Gemmatales bacterium]
MARRDALLKLHKKLVSRRDNLRRILAGELADLSDADRSQFNSDLADAAFDAGADEIASQLAQIEATELAQIERAIKRLQGGTYGLCESCDKRIPVARLNALPYSTMCIECAREAERARSGGGFSRRSWDKVYDAESAQADRQVNLNDLEMELPTGGR